MLLIFFEAILVHQVKRLLSLEVQIIILVVGLGPLFSLDLTYPSDLVLCILDWGESHCVQNNPLC
jgi:hypothetical protein